MKKLLILATIIGSFPFLSAQETEKDAKKINAGLSLGTGMNFMSEQTNLLSSSGVGFDFSIGMIGDYSLNNNIAITSGLEFDFTRFRYDLNNNFQGGGPVFVNYSDKDILRGNSDVTPDGVFRVDERRTRAIYATLPIMLKFQTNYMGYFRYFGRFGVRNSFLMRSRGDFEGANVGVGTSTEGSLEDMKISRDLSIYRGSVGMSLGAEWNFAGSTSLVGELGYFYGFTDVHRGGSLIGSDDKNLSMYQLENIGAEPKYRSLSATPGQLILKISVLF